MTISTKANVGLFVLVGLLLFGVGLFWIGDQKKLFSRGFEVRAEFENLAGLESSAKVRVAGLDAGEVRTIALPQDASSGYRLTVRLDRTFRPLIRQDSVAHIETDGLVGNKFLEIDKGDPDAMPCADPCRIKSAEALEFSDLMQDASTLLQNTNTTVQSANDVAMNMNRVLETFLSRNEDGKNGAKNLTDTMASAQRAMTNLADDTEALKHNFLFRGFFNHRGFFNLSEMTPADYRDSEFAKSKASKRVWLEAGALFSRSRTGSQTLSKAGQNAVDAGMAELVAYLPNSPLVVEGYADEGTPGQRFLESQQRAFDVQDYLIKRYQLNPKYVGAMPLSDSPPKQGGKTTWNGVALTLVPAK